MAFSSIPIGKKAPQVLNAVIEIPKGSPHKFEYDEELDEIKLDRVLFSSVYYPTEYGFIPETRSEDGDHLDVLVIISAPTFPGCVISVRPISVLNMEDEAGKDWKIIAVAEKDPRFKEIQTIDDMEAHFKKEIKNFFEVYKQLENKKVTVHEWRGKEEAYRLIDVARDRYAKENHQ